MFRSTCEFAYYQINLKSTRLILQPHVRNIYNLNDGNFTTKAIVHFIIKYIEHFMHSLEQRFRDVVTYKLVLNKWLMMRSKTSDQ